MNTSVSPSLPLQVAQQVQHLRLDRHVERRHGLVGDQQLRAQRERARDADALALAAGELVRVAVVVLRVQPDRLHQPLHLAFALALVGNSSWIANGSAMIEPIVLRGFSDEYGSWKIICTSRLTAFRSRALQLRDVAALEADLARGRVEQAHHQPRRGALAAAGLADDAERLAALDLEARRRRPP